MSAGIRAVFLIGALAGLAACATFGGQTSSQAPRSIVEAPPIATQPPPMAHSAPAAPFASLARDPSQFYTPRQMAGRQLIRVAILLPFNSSRASVRTLSTSLYNAAQLALFEFNNADILLIPKATGSAMAAQKAAEDAIREGADLILGPLFAEEVSAVAPVAHASNVPVVAFSSDTNVSGNGVYLLSFPPDQDVNRIVDFAVLKGMTSFAALFPQSDYGNRVRAAFTQSVADHGSHVVAEASYPSAPSGMNQPVKRIANYDSRHGELLAKRAELKKAGDAAGLKALEKRDTLSDVTFQAVFVPEGGAKLRALAPLLPYYDVDPRKVKFLGTGLWDDPSLFREPSLAGGWFPAPPLEAHAQFVARYRRVYGDEPPRIASLAYDGVSLAVALSAHPSAERFTPDALTHPDGFAGVDGIFRFMPDGRTERGLAILEMRQTGPVVIDPAPQSFNVAPGL